MSSPEESVVVEETGIGLFQLRVRTGRTALFADEPVSAGGLNSGPDPFEMVAAALASCTVMTMRLYARRKGWKVPKLSAAVRHVKPSASERDRFELIIRLEPDMDSEWRAGLLEMARRCPVHRLLLPGADIVTHVTTSELPFPLTGALHAKILDELCPSSGAEAEAA